MFQSFIYAALFLREKEIGGLYHLSSVVIIKIIIVFLQCYFLFFCKLVSEFFNMVMLMIVQKGHGIPDSLLKEVKIVAHKFFDRPYDEKIKIKMTPATGHRFASWNTILHIYFVNEHQFYDND